MTGNELKAVRRAKGLSRMELARLAEVHPDTVKYWELKQYITPCGYAPQRLAAALGISAITLSDKRSKPGHVGDFSDQYARANRLLLNPQRSGPARKRCGARTRTGTPCNGKAIPGKLRCKFHGGLSTGPRTIEGRAQISAAQKRRWALVRSKR